MKRVICWIYEYFGIRFIVLKFKGKPANDPNFKEPPSGVLWLLGIHIAAFGISSQQYTRAIDTEKILTANYEVPESVRDNEYCNAMNRYEHFVTLAPVKPSLYNPITNFRSLFGDDVPSMDPTSTEARELENYTWRLLSNASRFVEKQKSGRESILGISSPFFQGNNLQLDQPYRYEYVFVSYLNNTVEITREPMSEPEGFDGVYDASKLSDVCFLAIGPNPELRTSADYYQRYDCTNVILRRACEETREKLETGTFEIPPKEEQNGN